MIAASAFAGELGPDTEGVSAELFGSLALTGRGHSTDVAVMLGLTGACPDTLDPDEAATIAADIRTRHRLTLTSGPCIAFDPGTDIVFRLRETLPLHPNGLRFSSIGKTGSVIRTYYSVGGGFVVDEAGRPLSAQGGEPAPVPTHLQTQPNCSTSRTDQV
jgi:L-serine dehydratase